MRAARIERGLSQAELAQSSGLTRQTVYSIESQRYLPNVSVALRLAQTLGRRVEDLFGLDADGPVVDGDLLGGRRRPSAPRAKVWSVGERTLVLPIACLGTGLTYSVPADGLIVGPAPGSRRARRVRVQLLQDPRAVRQQVVVAGCDPAIQLVSERLRQQPDPVSLFGWPMGSTAATARPPPRSACPVFPRTLCTRTPCPPSRSTASSSARRRTRTPTPPPT